VEEIIMPRSTRKTELGTFTLIELLVVITIIAILASMLSAVVHRKAKYDRKTACLSNERQIHLAVMGYISDHDEYFPMARSEKKHGGDAVEWFEPAKVGRYLDITEPVTTGYEPAGVLACPSASYVARTSNYAALAEIWGADWQYGPKRLPTYTKPDQKVCVYDAKLWWSPAWGSWATIACSSYLMWGTRIGAADFRHVDGHNVVFLDGSARWYEKDPDDVRAYTGWRYRQGAPTDDVLSAYSFSSDP